jgi:hypothetical protein
MLDVFGVEAGHRVVFLAALVALGVAAALAICTMMRAGMRFWAMRLSRMRAVLRSGLPRPGPSVGDRGGSGGARDVLGWDVDRDGALVVDGVRLDDQGLGVVRIGDAELFAGDAGVEALRGLRIDLELLDLALRHAFDGLGLRGGDIGRADEVVAVGERSLVAELHEGRCTRGVERTRRRRGASLFLGA